MQKNCIFPAKTSYPDQKPFEKIIGTYYKNVTFNPAFTELLTRISLNDALIIDNHIEKVIEYVIERFQEYIKK